MKHRCISAFPTLAAGNLCQRPDRGQSEGWWNENVALLSSGRAAAFHAVKHFGIQKPGKILVPSYHCGVEIEALLRAGADIKYYPVGQDMMVPTHEILARIDPDVKALLLIHYWGFSQNTTAISEVCKRHGILLIEDCAHALFSGHQDTLLGSKGDASLYSFTKTLAVPDGGALRLNSDRFGPGAVTNGNNRVGIKHGFRLFLKNLQSTRLRPLAKMADCVFALRQKNELPSGEDGSDYGETAFCDYNRGASGLSKAVFRRSSGMHIRAQRRKNYSHLLDRLAGVQGLKIVFEELEEGTCPLFFSIVVENRNELEEYLEEDRIKTFVFGRNLHPSLDRQEFHEAQYLSQHVLGLPVHQRLTERDMQTIANRVRQWASAQLPVDNT